MSDEPKPTVLLTGGTGFIGAAVLRALQGTGAPIVLLKRARSSPWRIADLLDGQHRITTYDVDDVRLEAVFGQHRVDVVIHLATAYGRHGELLSDIIEANVLFPVRVLQAAIAAGTGAFLSADSFSTKADELPEGLAQYVLTKKHFRQCAELLVARHSLRFVNVRIEHAYGPRDGNRKFVPALVRALRANQANFDLTPGEQVRDFVYVDDIAAAFVTLVWKYNRLPANYFTVDVGTGSGQSLRSMALLARELTRSTTELRFGALPYRSGELMRSVADTRFLRELGWEPEVSLRDGLMRTIEAAKAC